VTDLDRERHEARKLTTDQVVELRRALDKATASNRERDVYISELQAVIAHRDRQIADLEDVLMRMMQTEAAAAPRRVNDEPTAKHRRRAA